MSNSRVCWEKPPAADRRRAACYPAFRRRAWGRVSPGGSALPEQFDFEGALREFCRAWSEAVGRRSPIVGGRLFHKTVNTQVTGGDVFAITFSPQGADMRKGSDPAAAATLAMSEEDWRNVLAGRYGVWSVQLASRQRPVLEEDALLRQLGLIMQSFALRK